MRLKEWRRLNGLTLTKAGRLFKCANSTHYSRIETGESWVTGGMGQRIETITHLIDGNSVTVDDLHAQWLLYHLSDAQAIALAAGRTANAFNRGREKERTDGKSKSKGRTRKERQDKPQGRKGRSVRGRTGA